MSVLHVVKIPDLGTDGKVDVIEILVKPGSQVNKDDSLLTLESDKATMEIPAPLSGEVESIRVAVGDKVSTGMDVLVLRVAADTGTDANAKPVAAEAPIVAAPPAPAAAMSAEIDVLIPDIGSTSAVDIIEIQVKPGQTVAEGDSLLTLESDKATMDIPAPQAGEIIEIVVKVGDKVTTGHRIMRLRTTASKSTPTPTAPDIAPPPVSAPIAAPTPAAASSVTTSSGSVHAGPAVRQFARELGVDLSQVQGSGPKSRILKSDVQQFVKSRLQQSSDGGIGLNIPSQPEIDFSQFGPIASKPLNKIKRLTGAYTHRSWVTIPHVTQFDEADITELEAFRNAQKKQAEERGVKLTPLVFIMKAVVSALKAFPQFNASLDARGENLIYKQYFHLGVAVETPNGLVVPVVRDVDQKGLFDLALELAAIGKKAREKGLTPKEMQGSCFTISSLGGIGGTAFTPIVNAPDVAILGVSKSAIKPVYQDGQFVPRLMLPLSLSYDHRVIDGAEAARFSNHLTAVLSDLRRLLL
jgi:pyruvate dehydrogenase E2 component (dihydrolipoamide acetyltransferase)